MPGHIDNQEYLVLLRWLITVEMLSISLIPLLALMMKSGIKRGYGVAKVISFFVSPGLLWLISSIVPIPYSWWIWVAVLIITIVWPLAKHIRHVAPIIPTALFYELVFIALMVIYAFARSNSPAISHTEQPMDFNILNSLITHFPNSTPDTWLVGESINYYYFGYIPFATTSILGQVPAVFSYNFGLATIFSLAIIAIASVSTILIRRAPRSLLTFGTIAMAAVITILTGNLLSVWRTYSSVSDHTTINWWSEGGLGWSTTRVIHDQSLQGLDVEAISEYPLFSLILGDMHPHLIALPLNIALIGLASSLVLTFSDAKQLSSMSLISQGALLGLPLGFLLVANPWDAPIQILFAASCLYLMSRGSFYSFVIRGGGLLFALSLPLLRWITNYRFPSVQGGPSVIGVDLPVGSTLAVTSTLTSYSEFFSIWGVHYVVTTLVVIMGIAAKVHSRSQYWRWLKHFTIAAAVLALFGLLVGSAAVVMVSLLLMPIAFLLSSPITENQSRSSIDATLPAILAFGTLFIGWATLLIPELFYIPDLFHSRMNTIFKFYYQSWILLGIGCCTSLFISITSYNSSHGKAQAITSLFPILISLVLCIVAPFSYTQFLATDRVSDPTFRADTALEQNERDGLAWILSNTQEDQVVLEAAGCSYRGVPGASSSRVSTFTGRPTVVGWVGHEQQWRVGIPGAVDEINRRVADVNDMYSDPDNMIPFDKYSVDYVYIGLVETSGVAACPDSPLPQNLKSRYLESSNWTLVYDNATISIFERSIYP